MAGDGRSDGGGGGGPYRWWSAGECIGVAEGEAAHVVEGWAYGKYAGTEWEGRDYEVVGGNGREGT